MAHADYATLKQRVVRAGLLDKRPRAALMTIMSNLLLLAGAIASLGWFRSLWVVALIAIMFSVLTGQFGFVMHDTGHRQLFRRAWQNHLVGWLHANVLLGISYGAWIRQHNAHHGTEVLPLIERWPGACGGGGGPHARTRAPRQGP